MPRTAWRGWCTNRGDIADILPDLGPTLVRLLHQDPHGYGIARSRWRLADLRVVVPALATYTISGLSRLVARLGYSQQRGRLHLQSPDPAYADKMARITKALALARRYPVQLRVCYGDEVSLYRQPSLGPCWAVRGDEPLAQLSQRSNTRLRVSGALDATTGQVTTLSASRMTLAALKRFLRTLRAAYPTQRLLLIWDNWPVHAHPSVVAEAAALKIGLLWLPTYAPWENPIEKLWRWLKQEVAHHHRLADDWEGLKAAVAAFLARFARDSPALLRYVGLLPN